MGSTRKPGISVVLPVYNAGQYLGRCLDSLLDQDIDPSLVEIVAVDDGSTDGSPAVLDEYAAQHPAFRVIGQDNSGGPGRPRNVGIDAGDREYVFFADADDYLGPQALRRMYEFATRNGSDVTIPKLIGVGRLMHKRAWAQTQVDADLRLAFLTMSPQKLIRRAFLEEQGLRFPEGGVRFEDGILLSRAYLTASRVSLLGDYDYYYVALRDDLGNRSEQAFDPYGFCGSLRAVMDTMWDLCRDRELAESLVLDLYRRKALKPFTPQRFPNWPEDRQRNWVDAVRKLADTHVPEELEECLTYPFNLRAHLARTGDRDALARHTGAEAAGRVPGRVGDGRVLVDVDTAAGPRSYDATASARLHGELERVGRGFRTLSVQGRARLDGLDVRELPVRVVAQERASGTERGLAVVHERDEQGWVRFRARLPAAAFPPASPTEGEEVWSVLVRVDVHDGRLACRLADPGGPRPRRKANLPVSLPIRRSRCEAQPYVTIYGNLAVRIEATGVSPTTRRVTSARLVLEAARRRVRRAVRGRIRGRKSGRDGTGQHKTGEDKAGAERRHQGEG